MLTIVHPEPFYTSPSSNDHIEVGKAVRPCTDLSFLTHNNVMSQRQASTVTRTLAPSLFICVDVCLASQKTWSLNSMMLYVHKYGILGARRAIQY